MTRLKKTPKKATKMDEEQGGHDKGRKKKNVMSGEQPKKSSTRFSKNQWAKELRVKKERPSMER